MTQLAIKDQINFVQEKINSINHLQTTVDNSETIINKSCSNFDLLRSSIGSKIQNSKKIIFDESEALVRKDERSKELQKDFHKVQRSSKDKIENLEAHIKYQKESILTKIKEVEKIKKDINKKERFFSQQVLGMYVLKLYSTLKKLFH